MKHFLILIAITTSSFGSAWVREKGGLFLSPAFFYYEADKYFDKDGNKKPIGCKFHKREVQLYGEFGVTDNYTLTFKVPYANLKCNASNSGLGDAEIGVIRSLKKGKSNISAYTNVIIPTGYSLQEEPRLGYARYGLEGGLLYGFSGKWGFFDSGGGLRYYFGYPSTQFRAYVVGGYNLSRWLLLYGQLDAQIGLGDGKRKVIGQNIFLEPDYKLIQLYVGPRFIYGKGSVGFGYQKVIWGRNTGDGSGFFLNVWQSF
ncbi:MAG: hypothetical protein RMJ32_04855 [Aquificaceae bacterium]|nr:hypothetical protein [Aquificaceae bacterium]